MMASAGTRYAYSGEGLILLQFVLETGLGLQVGDEMQRRLTEATLGDPGMPWTWEGYVPYDAGRR